ncbi:MAG TPA: ABC transporter ATP-binding protein, partial [Candidatus Lambdaproteobacteria bacterium]|nr:ABC transporter ATP-binding protein [Candidatus Lambdaproteobacteria bacterium]
MQPLLSIRNLEVQFSSLFSKETAVRSISFDIQPAETLAVVGESGSGKSVTALSIMGLIRKTGGTILDGSIIFRKEMQHEIDMVSASGGVMESIRGNEIAMIFQEPMTSLNPVFTVESQICEALITHKKVSLKEAKKEALEVMRQVQIPEPRQRLNQYPHELSGGMRQRVMIAMALVCRPKLMIADEPTTALDVTIQAQILWLLKKLKEETGMALMFITHDLGVVAQIAERVLVMSNGEVVETGEVGQIYAKPSQEYTKKLIATVPVLGKRKTVQIEGTTKEVQEDPILSIINLSVRFRIKTHFWTRVRKEVLAVDRVSLEIATGQTLGLVGESGCGKSTICKAIVGLAQASSGSITIDGLKISTSSTRQPLQARRNTQIIFQDPLSSLSPRRTAFSQIAEPLIIHKYGTSSEIKDRVEWLTNKVGLNNKQLERYPHEFSGGQKQRLCIARALALKPKLIIADEPVSALDVSIQANVLDLMREIQSELNITYLFISHDMAVIEEMSDNIAVMFMGRIVEYGDRKSVLDNPTHPYTQNLLRAVPVPDPNVKFKPPIFYDEDRFDPIVEVGSQNLEPLQYTQVSKRHLGLALEQL